VACSREAETEGIAQTILERRGKGVPFRDQVVLSRTHTTLARLAQHLERSGVPCLYFGDFFERPEVRDLLSLLSIVSEPKGTGLLRAAQLPQYAVPVDDIAKAVTWRRSKKVTMLVALRNLDEIDSLSDVGRVGLRRLADDTATSTWPMTAHQFLIGYIFGSGGYARTCLAGNEVPDQQRRLAVYQLLQLAFAFKPLEKEDPKRAFLDHVRRLEILDEEKQLRQQARGSSSRSLISPTSSRANSRWAAGTRLVHHRRE
jgi:DNA helicase II / ATP-dependent DNA helicase PcrA